MTDGIIQQVFHSWLDKHVLPNGILQDFTIHTLTELKQELIEKIKQVNPIHNNEKVCSGCELTKLLIGDNQE